MGHEKIESLQAMRALAALSVVAFHALREIPGLEDRMIGEIGVDIFFVLSGFIMWTTASAAAPADFLKRRIVRIVPLYWAITLAVALSTPRGAQGFSPDVIAKSLLFMPQDHPHYDRIGGVLPVGWTLEIEMFFYLLFAASLAIAARWRLQALVAALVVIAAVGFAHEGGPPAVRLFTSNIILEFAAGLLLGRFYVAGRMPKSAGIALGCVVAGGAVIALIPRLPDIRALEYGLAAAFFVAAAVAGRRLFEGRWAAAPSLIGDASYSIYLTHFLTFAISGALVAPFLDVAPHVALAVYMTVATLAGLGVYFAVERPLTEAARRLARRTILFRKAVAKSARRRRHRNARWVRLSHPAT